MEYTDETCLVYSKLPKYKKRLLYTQKSVEKMLGICEKPYIAFSCGKDSSVLADIILTIDNTIRCRFISSGETRIIHNVDTVIDYFKEKHDADIEEIVFDRVWSEEWANASFDEQRKAGRHDIQNINNDDYDGVFMGLRKQESRGRCISLVYHNTDGLPVGMYKYHDRDFYRMCPLANWKIEDIGAYIATHNIPTLDWYKEYGYEARTTARLTGDAVRGNTLFYIKQRNLLGYQKLIQRFPELSILT